jgi:hypothetical protein
MTGATASAFIDEIVEVHFKNGKRVDHLIMILTR